MNREPEQIRKEYPLTFEEINKEPHKRLKEIAENPNPIVLLLDRLDDVRNIGSLFRLADAGRVSMIYGFRMRQNDHSKINRVSRQTASQIAYHSIDSVEEVRKLAYEFTPIALEYTNKSIAYHTFTSHEPCMLIIGNERQGVSPELLQISKKSLNIPMLGKNSSMNVYVSAGIVLYHLICNMNKL